MKKVFSYKKNTCIVLKTDSSIEEKTRYNLVRYIENVSFDSPRMFFRGAMQIDVLSSSEQDFKTRLFNLLLQFSVEKSEVILASGKSSSIYFDCRQVYFRGEAQFILGELFFREMLKIENRKGQFSACGGMAMGSIPLTCALVAASFRRGRELPGFAVRKDAKDHGMLHTIEGNKCLLPHHRILVVEDVVTTGSSVKNAILKLRKENMIIDSVLTIIDREQGGQKNLQDIDVDLYSLFMLKDFNF